MRCRRGGGGVKGEYKMEQKELKKGYSRIRRKLRRVNRIKRMGK
jgi:hypothetical protein